MYPFILSLHSWTRHLVVACLVCTVVRALYGWLSRSVYTTMDTRLRQSAVAALHLQVLVGFLLYAESPVTAMFRSDTQAAGALPEVVFFAVTHGVLMLTAAVVLTIGGAKVRRAQQDAGRFRTTLVYFAVAMLLVCIAIPWPFSPLAARPWIRPL